MKKSLATIYKNPAFSEFGKPCDYILKTEDGTSEFQVYKEPLSKQSEFFKAPFSFNRQFEQSSNCIHGIQPEILEMILIYLYTGEISLNTENEMRLLFASDFLLIESLKHECRMSVLQNQTYKNCINLFLTAYQMKGFNLENQCRRFLLLCFEKAIKHSKVKSCNLPYESLLYFLPNKSVNVSGECFIWSFMEAWVQKDPSNRMSKVPELLRCLSLNEIDEKLASDIISSPIIQENELYTGMKQPLHSKREQILSYCFGDPFITDVRQPQRLYFVARGFSERSGAELFISYDESLDVWRKLGKSFKPYKLLRIDHRIYMFKSKLDKTGIRIKAGGSIYDLITGTTFCMTPVFCISIQYVAALGRIYAVKSCGNIVRYEDETNRWLHEATVSLFLRIDIIDAVSLNDLIYIMCSADRYGRFMHVYDPSARRWYHASPPNIQSKRTHPGSIVYQGKIFFIGGLGEHQWFSDVEAYDPVLNEWTVYPDVGFSFSSLFMELVVDQGHLCAYKRHLELEDDDRKVPLVACWDGSGEWKGTSEYSSLLHLSFCVIEGEDVVREVMKKNRNAGTPKWKKTGLEDLLTKRS